MNIRIGHGFDAHRLVEGRPLMLGAVEVPHDRGLLGHSDGDAAAHALADAVLGGAGLGDLGSHFPSGEERWRGVSGAELLRQAADRIREAGWQVASAQVVVLAEQPRLSPHTAAMAEAMAGALGMTADRLSVSATSTDGMGMIGRMEGIAASAVVLLASIS